MIKELTVEELFALNWGDKVLRIIDGNDRTLSYVGRMPGSKNYLIFSDGEYLTHLYISPKDGSHRGKWYPGNSSISELGEILISQLEQNIENIKKNIENIREIYK